MKQRGDKGCQRKRKKEKEKILFEEEKREKFNKIFFF